jgi:hypothetical protein
MMLRGTLGLLALSVSALALAADSYLVEAELWLEGELRGMPTMIIEAGEPASLEREGDDDGFRLEIEIEPVHDPLAPANSLWLAVAIFQKSDDDWEHVADSILGVPEGQTATLSVVDDDAPATPETAAVYLRIKTSRLHAAD